MPTTTSYDYAAGAYETTLTCSDCSTSVTFAGRPHYEESADQTFRWHTSGGRYLGRCRPCERAHNNSMRQARAAIAASVQSVELDGDRTYGIEIEMIFTNGNYRQTVQAALIAAGLRGWKAKDDASLSGGTGCEVVSPPIKGATGIAQLRKVCEILNELGATVNRTCGLHVHHGVDDLSMEDWKRLIKSWTNNQSTIDRLVSRSRRAQTGGYCQMLRSHEIDSIMACSTLRELKSQYIQRYRALNVMSYAKHGTVEIRQHQGTLDAAKIEAWIEFGQSMIAAAKIAEVPAEATVPSLLARLADLSDGTREFLTQRSIRLAGAVS